MSYYRAGEERIKPMNKGNDCRVKVASVKIPRHMAESDSYIRLRKKNKKIIESLKEKERVY